MRPICFNLGILLLQGGKSANDKPERVPESTQLRPIGLGGDPDDDVDGMDSDTDVDGDGDSLVSEVRS